MIKKSFTAVVSRNETFNSNFYTEPYEVAWAGEARWFVRVIDKKGEDFELKLFPEISPDGLFWCDEGSGPLVIKDNELYSFSLREFGHWLRLRGNLEGREVECKLIIYLTLKE
jgi:hypothetical protein